MENEYKVQIRRDTGMMKTFINFNNRVNHPRVTFHLFLIGALLISIPIVAGGGKLWGVLICYILGGFLVFMSLFRKYIAVYRMKKSPEIQVDEELTYLFTPKGVRVCKEGEPAKNLGSYKNIYEVWEDETHYYLGMNKEDLLILPFSCFTEGDPAKFRDFILEKSKAPCTWKPAGFFNRLKEAYRGLKNRTLQQQAALMSGSPAQKEKDKKSKKKDKGKK